MPETHTPAPPVAARRLLWRTWLALVAAPALLLGCLVLKYGVDGAYLDQWLAISPLFEKWETGTLAAGDFFAQHNEHRFVAPKLVFFAVGLLTHWNVRVELFLTWLTLVLVAATFRKLPGQSSCSPLRERGSALGNGAAILPS